MLLLTIPKLILGTYLHHLDRYARYTYFLEKKAIHSYE